MTWVATPFDKFSQQMPNNNASDAGADLTARLLYSKASNSVTAFAQSSMAQVKRSDAKMWLRIAISDALTHFFTAGAGLQAGGWLHY